MIILLYYYIIKLLDYCIIVLLYYYIIATEGGFLTREIQQQPTNQPTSKQNLPVEWGVTSTSWEELAQDKVVNRNSQKKSQKWKFAFGRKTNLL